MGNYTLISNGLKGHIKRSCIMYAYYRHQGVDLGFLRGEAKLSSKSKTVDLRAALQKLYTVYV